MLFLQRSTECGRFTVSITSNVPESSSLLAQEAAQSLKELSDILASASTLAMQAAVQCLETHVAPPAVDAVARGVASQGERSTRD